MAALDLVLQGAGSVKKSFDDQEYMVYWPAGNRESCDAILFAVGTTISVEKYPDMAATLVEKGFVVVVVDPEKGSMTKLNAEKSKAAFDFAKANLMSWVPSCGRVSKWIVGGHSAGGGTAHAVVAANPSIADAMFQVDPFDLAMNGKSATVTKPVLVWGFDYTTCFVSKENAALMAYENTDNERKVFVRVQRQNVWSSCGYGPKFLHCSVGGGCAVCGSCADTPPEFFKDMASTVDQFLVDAFARSWAPKVGDLKMDVPLDVFHTSNAALATPIVNPDRNPALDVVLKGGSVQKSFDEQEYMVYWPGGN